MAQKFLSNIELEAGLVDVNGNTGTAGQILSSTGTGVDWISQSEISSDSAETVEVPVKNLQGSALTKGDPVYISGTVGASGILEVQLADAGNTAKMPAVGLLKQDLAINGEGYAVVTGKLRNLVTSPIDGVTPSEGDVVYVKSGGSTGAALTTTKPTGSSNLIQNMGKVGRVSTAADGTYVVSSILRSNDVPNLTTGKIWVGDGNTTESTVVHLDESNSRMGIGETLPGTILDIKGANPYVTINTTSTYTSWGVKAEKSGSSIGRLEWVTNSFLGFGAGVILTSGTSYIQIPDSTTYDFALNLVGNRVMQIDSGTRTVGIGTTIGLNNAPTYGVQPNLVLGSDTSTTGGVLSLYNYDTTIEAGNTLGIIQFVGKDDASSSSGYTAATIRTYTHAAAGAGNSGGGELAFSTASSGAGSSPGERMRIDHAGNVGIGTTDPSEKLDVNGSIAARETGAGNGFLLHTNSGITANNNLMQFWSGQSSGLSFHTNSTGDGSNEKMRITSSGNVGIGASNPGQKLEVNGSIHAKSSNYCEIGVDQTDSAAIRMGVSSGSVDTFIDAYNTGAGHAAGTPNIKLLFNTSEKFRFTGSGNLGIGTTNPQKNLVVSDTSDAVIRIDNSKNGTWTQGEPLGQLEFYGNDASGEGAGVKARIQAIAKDSFGAAFSMRFGTSDGANGIQNRMAIRYDGNVGIGTTDPQVKMHASDGGTIPSLDAGTMFLASNTSGTGDYSSMSIMSGTSGIASLFFGDTDAEKRGAVRYLNSDEALRFRTANTDRVSIKGNGAVGIGTTNPSTLLHLSSNNPVLTVTDTESTYRYAGLALATNGGTWNLSNGDSTTAANSHLYITRNSAGTDNRFIFHRDSYYFGVYDNTNVIKAVIRANGDSYFNGGDVGIGTTSPSEELHIVSTSPGVRLQDSDGTNTFGRVHYSGASLYFYSRNNTSNGNFIFVGSNGTADTEFMRINNSGNVGIGTTNPSQKLDVDGYIAAHRFTDSDNASFYLEPGSGATGQWQVQTPSGYVRIGPNNTSWAHFYTDRSNGYYFDKRIVADTGIFASYNEDLTLQAPYNTTRMTINSSTGNVGIGTTNPAAKLDIDGVGAAATGIRMSAGTNTQFTVETGSANDGIVKVKGNDAATRVYLTGASSQPSYFTEKLGIGKSSDIQANLDVEGPIRVIGGTFSSGTSGADSNASTGIVLRRGKKLFSGIPNGSNQDFYLRSLIEQTSSNEIIIGQGGTALITDISLKPGTSGNVRFFTTGSETMRINSSGNVGIGTTNPTSDLHISDSFPRITLQDSDGTNTLSYIDQDSSYLNLIARNGTNNGNIRFRRYDGTTTSNSMIINSSGKVGVGTDNPHGLLSSSQAQNTGNAFTNPHLALMSSTATDGGFVGMTFAASSAINYGYSVGAHRTSSTHSDFEINYHYNNAAGTNRFIIDQTGKVGINTTSPAARLHVVGEGQGAKIVSSLNVGLEVQGGGNSTDIAIFRDTSGNEEFSIDANGVLYSLGMASSSSSNATLMHNNTTGQIYRYSSSIRYKEDVTDLESAVDKIQKLRPVKFKVKQTGEYNTGMIAEEVAEVMPEITYKADVEGFDTPQVDGISYEPLHAYYIRAIQEQQELINDLKARIEVLENK